MKSKLTHKKINRLFQKLSEAIPEPTTELNYKNNFELLIAVILSAQATDVSVNKATPELFEAFSTPQELAQADQETVRGFIKTIGLFKNKATNIIKTSQLLTEKYDGEVPQTHRELEELPGVGRKTANVILNTAFGQLTIAVDTHVFRVGNRTGLGVGKTPIHVEEQLLKRVPKKWKRDAHHYLILHGRYVCKAQKPLCWICPIMMECEYEDKSEETVKKEKSKKKKGVSKELS